MTMVDYAAGIRKAVEKSGIPITKLAVKSGLSKNMWYDAQCGRHSPHLENLLIMAETLGYESIDEFIGIK